MSIPALSITLEQLALHGQPVLHPMRLALPAGAWTAIVGPNGAGKSTLLKALAGVLGTEARFKGDVTWSGRALSGWPAAARARHLAWLSQGDASGLDLRAQDVVMLGRLPHQGWWSAPSDADILAVQQAMQRTHCWDWRCKPLSQLSGGERQRVWLARALAVQAQVLLMDEPLSHLDPPHQADWLDIVREQLAAGVTVVSVLHELQMALLATHLVILRDGQLVHQGPTSDARTRAALEKVFDRRIRLCSLDTPEGPRWVALPHTD